MKLREFLLTKTQPLEMCVIKDCGWAVTTAWVDYEDLFMRELSEELAQREVKRDYWENWPIVSKHGKMLSIPCHTVEVAYE